MAFDNAELCELMLRTLGWDIHKLYYLLKTLKKLKTLGGAVLAPATGFLRNRVHRLQGYSSLQHTGSVVPED